MSGNRLPLAQEARSLGKYEVLGRLSTGGMAEIFLASQRGLAGFHKPVVLKQILPDIRGEEEFVRMFLDEAKVTAAFNHPHIAQVYDLDIADGELFLAMEFVPGATLVEVARACRQANTPIPMGYSLMAVRDTAVALHYAHTFTDPLGRPSPVIHRDVAEKNIMVTYEGVTKLLDFGIAKSLARAGRTAVGTVKGTSGYMSPEQIMGDPLDARSDLFSLGVVLHECLTGMRLFYAKQAEAMMNAVLRCEVTPPSRTNRHVPPELDAIVMRALARRREDRYATTLEFARAIERAVGPLIWHPEQSSELMLRLFSDRREQTRQLLLSGQSDAEDTTGVVKLAKVMAMSGPESADAPPKPSPPRRATTSVPSAAVVEKPVRTPVLRAPPGKRLTPQPPPPPADTLSTPPPEPGRHNAPTAPGLPALPPEHTVRAKLPASLQDTGAPPPASGETAPRQGARAASADVPRAEARSRTTRTVDGLRAAAAPPQPAERDLQTAMIRMPVGPPERGGDTVSVTPPARRSTPPRRRQSPPPDEQRTLPPVRVDAMVEEEDDASTLDGRSGVSEHTLPSEGQPPRRRGWASAAAVGVVGVLALGATGVMLGWDGGAISGRLKPLLGQTAPPPKAQARLGNTVGGAPRMDAAMGPDTAAAGSASSVADTPDTPAREQVPAGDVASVALTDQATAQVLQRLNEGAPDNANGDEATVREPRTFKRVRGGSQRDKVAVTPVRKPQAPKDTATSSPPASEPGFLTLVTEPKAQVFLGRRDLGKTPLFNVKLPAGQHTLKLVDATDKAHQVPVDIKSGETTSVRGPLSLLADP